MRIYRTPKRFKRDSMRVGISTLIPQPHPHTFLYRYDLTGLVTSISRIVKRKFVVIIDVPAIRTCVLFEASRTQTQTPKLPEIW